MSFESKDLSNLAAINKDFGEMIPIVIRSLDTDFAALREPRLNFKNQGNVDRHRVDMATAAMVHFGLDPGKFVRWMGGEYTGS